MTFILRELTPTQSDTLRMLDRQLRPQPAHQDQAPVFAMNLDVYSTLVEAPLEACYENFFYGFKDQLSEFNVVTTPGHDEVRRHIDVARQRANLKHTEIFNESGASNGLLFLDVVLTDSADNTTWFIGAAILIYDHGRQEKSGWFMLPYNASNAPTVN